MVLTLYLRSRPEVIPLGASVLEIGAGLGLPSIDLSRRRPSDDVTATDGRRECVSHLAANAANAAPKIKIRHLDYADPSRNATTADVVIASDVCYLDSLVEPLARFLHTEKPRVTLIAAPTTRKHLYDLAANLIQLGAHVSEERFSLLASDAAADAAAAIHATHHRVLAVSWPPPDPPSL